MIEALNISNYLSKLLNFSNSREYLDYKSKFWAIAQIDSYIILALFNILWSTKDVFSLNISPLISLPCRLTVLLPCPFIIIAYLKNKKEYLWIYNFITSWLGILGAIIEFTLLKSTIGGEGWISYILVFFVLSIFSPKEYPFTMSYCTLFLLMYLTSDKGLGVISYIIPIYRLIASYAVDAIGLVIISFAIQGMLIKLYNLQKNLEKAAITDNLTGVYNRQIIETITKNGNLQNNAIIWMLDIDNFKKLNDNYSHNFGDECLINLTASLKNICCANDYIIRYGGDEFIVIFNDLCIDQFEKYEQLKKFINDTFTISVGSTIGLKNNNIYDIIKKSDEKLYKSKKIKNTITT